MKDHQKHTGTEASTQGPGSGANKDFGFAHRRVQSEIPASPLFRDSPARMLHTPKPRVSCRVTFGKIVAGNDMDN